MGVPYVVHDGVTLTGDLYAPGKPGRYPALVAVHGGAFQVGSPALYAHWGRHLAERGYVVFAIRYRLVANGRKMYPEAVQDVRAAVQYLRGRGEALHVDPERIGLMGDSAGAHLAALVALAGDQPPFAHGYPDDPYATVSAHVRACICIYGIYDLAAAWQTDLTTRPFDRPAEKFLGVPLVQNRRIYFEASPISYAISAGPIDAPAVAGRRRQPTFLLVWGSEDTVVPQNQAFLRALNQAGFFVRTVIVPSAPHFWVGDPLDETGSFTGFLAPRLLRFLETQLRP